MRAGEENRTKLARLVADKDLVISKREIEYLKRTSNRARRVAKPRASPAQSSGVVSTALATAAASRPSTVDAGSTGTLDAIAFPPNCIVLWFDLEHVGINKGGTVYEAPIYEIAFEIWRLQNGTWTKLGAVKSYIGARYATCTAVVTPWPQSLGVLGPRWCVWSHPRTPPLPPPGSPTSPSTCASLWCRSVPTARR